MNNGLQKDKYYALACFSVFVLFFLNTAQIYAQESGYAGSEACRKCHEDVSRMYSKNIHSRAGTTGAGETGCESCHGPGRNHAESGDPSAIINPAKTEAENSIETCMGCHGGNKMLTFWNGSAHANNNVACTGCHKVHGNRNALLARQEEKDVCFACHPNLRGALLQRSRHPLRDSSAPNAAGKMECSSCHNPHGTQSERLISAKSVNDKCYECHTEKKAPVLWEHSPVKEDCLICHTAHGSSNDKLLITKIPRLCQECHMQGRHQSGVLGTNSIFAVNRSCLNCHPMVHGSNHPSGPVLQR